MKKYWWILIVLAAVLAFLFDPIAFTLITLLRNPFLDAVAIFSTLYLLPLLVDLAVFVYLFFIKGKFQEFAVAVLCTEVIVGVLKILIGRDRPLNVLELLSNPQLYEFASWNSSFPSSHAALFFVMLPFLPKKVLPFGIVLAILLSLVRVYISVHYFSDVIVGALLGLGIGFFFSRMDFSKKH